MDKVASFEVDHERLNAGVYVSRQDKFGTQIITTFDVRLTAPYRNTPLSAAVLHTLEHLGAVYLREQSVWADRMLYWGPMGCQTGFDLLVFGDCAVAEAVAVLRAAFLFISRYEGDIPGAQYAWQCGNYRLHDLPGARKAAADFVRILTDWTPEKSVYPRRG
ncbi:MAG: S-ribosylhomocysteine lyase [Elusimicrobiaceae bacterium]|nr:S-ribosylhomocysteine lyase [Elusimicrobiaceae bacterium]